MEPPARPRLRGAVAADRSVVEDLLVRSWLTTWAPHLPAAAVERFRREAPVARYLDAALERLELAVVADGVAGVLHVEGDELVTLEVDPALEGRGIGTALLAHAEDRGARSLDVRAFNATAIAFYEHRGWRRVAVYETTELGAPVLGYRYERARPSPRRG